MNNTSISKMISTIQDIANYIRYEWYLTKGKNKKIVMQETDSKVEREFAQYTGVTKQEFIKRVQNSTYG